MAGKEAIKKKKKEKPIRFFGNWRKKKLSDGLADAMVADNKAAKKHLSGLVGCKLLNKFRERMKTESINISLMNIAVILLDIM